MEQSDLRPLVHILPVASGRPSRMDGLIPLSSKSSPVERTMACLYRYRIGWLLVATAMIFLTAEPSVADQQSMWERRGSTSGT